MTSRDISRRRFLSYLAALAGLGVVGGIAWAERMSGSATETSVSGGGAVAVTSPPPVESTSTAAPPPTTSTTSTSTTTTATSQPAQRAVQVICRDAWGALPVAGAFTAHTIERLTVHHTAVLLEHNREAPARARQHQQYHQDRGWADLAYHFLIDANGHVYEGRPIDTVGDTGTDYDPTGHFLVCCEGNFDRQEVSGVQLDALVDMLAWAAEAYGVSPETISGHRDWAQTNCPGEHLYSFVETGDLERAVAARMAESRVGLERICGDVAERLVADIEAGQA